jgi:ubiquinone/menaquinone biosynthesis C-methylase UbiE
MPWKYTDDYYREYTRTTWNESAEAYIELLKALEPFRADLIAAVHPQVGETFLDLGTGPGEPAMTIAPRVGDSGHVTGVDLSENMVSIARRVAAARHLENVTFEVMDSGNLTVPDSTFDAVVSCFGFQIFTEPEKAAREAHRVLKRGGRIAVAVWSTADRVPFLDVIIAPMMAHAEPDESGYLPTPYETGGPGEMVAFLESAGFHHAVERRTTHRVESRSVEDYLNTMLKATPLGHSLSEEEPAVQEEVLRTTRANLERWKDENGVSIPGECVVVTARK